MSPNLALHFPFDNESQSLIRLEKGKPVRSFSLLSLGPHAVSSFPFREHNPGSYLSAHCWKGNERRLAWWSLEESMRSEIVQVDRGIFWCDSIRQDLINYGPQ
jgi:hypothetical protein